MPRTTPDTITPETAEELRRLHAIARTVNGNTPLNHPSRKTSVEFTEALAVLVEQGITVYRLAKVLGVGHQSIYNRLARHGYRKPAPSQAGHRYRGTTTHGNRKQNEP